MTGSVDFKDEKILLEENKNLKNQIAELQDVIVSMCVLNQRQQSVKSFDDSKRQPKRRRKPSLNKFIESRESNVPIPQFLEVSAEIQPTPVQITPQDSKQGQSDCSSSATGTDRHYKSRQNRFTKAGLKK